eukprot:scaffold99246_cov34-Phaeocystis_antarctica.AAC.1
MVAKALAAVARAAAGSVSNRAWALHFFPSSSSIQALRHSCLRPCNNWHLLMAIGSKHVPGASGGGEGDGGGGDGCGGGGLGDG